MLWVEARPKAPERDAEFNQWHDHFYLRQALQIPGFIAATRYRLAHVQTEWYDPAASAPEWPFGKDFTYVTIYEINTEAPVSDLIQAVADTADERRSGDPDSDPVEWGPQWLYERFTEREGPVALKPDGLVGPAPNGVPNHIFVVPISPATPADDREMNRWYMTQVNVRLPGIAAATRYKLTSEQLRLDPRAPQPEVSEWPYGQHWYRTIYEMYDPVLAYRSLREARESMLAAAPRGRYAWMPQWPRRTDEHVIYEPVTYRVTPLMRR